VTERAESSPSDPSAPDHGSRGDPDAPGDPGIRDSPDAVFWMEEQPEPTGSDEPPEPEGSGEQREPAGTGRVRLGLIGELDVAAADQLRERLDTLALRGSPVLLDLRRLQFIDSSGVGELVRAVSDARRDGRSLEIDGTLSTQVRQVIDLLELRRVLWPDS
jgi:anti-anti-sigma factor